MMEDIDSYILAEMFLCLLWNTSIMVSMKHWMDGEMGFL